MGVPFAAVVHPIPFMGDRDEAVYFAKLAEQAERYDFMADYMKQVATSGTDLSVEERNLLAVAYKKAFRGPLLSRGAIDSIDSKVEEGVENNAVKHCNEYRTSVETELQKVCDTILGLLSGSLIPRAQDAESKDHKMKGGYYGCIAQVADGTNKSTAADKAKTAHDDAMTAANELELPIRMDLALKCAQFRNKVLNNPEEACKMARIAFDCAIAELENVPEHSFKEAELIMQMLRDMEKSFVQNDKLLTL